MKVNELCAVYGSLREGLGNHRLLTGAVRQPDGIVKDTFRMVSLGGFPGILKAANNSTNIVVEVYELDSEERIRRLDSLEGYPSFYNREKVTLEDGRVCWIYFLESARYSAHPPVDSGDWKGFRSIL